MERQAAWKYRLCGPEHGQKDMQKEKMLSSEQWGKHIQGTEYLYDAVSPESK